MSVGGDAPGFVQVLHARHLLIPDRLGPRRAHTLVPVIETAHLGPLFVIPGWDDVLRMKGRAWVVDGPG